MSKKKALILGASGMVGRELLALLLKDERYESVTALVRKPLPAPHPKLFQVSIDFERLAEQEANFRVHHVYCCLGTTIRQARTRSGFRRCDYHYVVEAAKFASRQGAEHFLVVSAVGADEHSPFFYSQVKGEMERDVYKFGPTQTTFVRPSFLMGDRPSDQADRPLEKLSLKIAKPLSAVLWGPLKKYRAVEAREVAQLLHQRAFGSGQAHPFVELVSLAKAQILSSPGQ